VISGDFLKGSALTQGAATAVRSGQGIAANLPSLALGGAAVFDMEDSHGHTVGHQLFFRFNS
jgi:hypothetical protein